MTGFQKEFCMKIMAKLSAKEISKPFYKSITGDFPNPTISRENAKLATELKTVHDKLENGRYDNINSWVNDVRNVCERAISGLSEDKPEMAMAKDLLSWFEKKCYLGSKDKTVPRFFEEEWIRKLQKFRDLYAKLMKNCPIKQELIPKPEFLNLAK